MVGGLSRARPYHWTGSTQPSPTPLRQRADIVMKGEVTRNGGVLFSTTRPPNQLSTSPRQAHFTSLAVPVPLHRSSHSFAPYPTTRPGAHPPTELCMVPTMGIIAIPIKPLRFIREPGWTRGVGLSLHPSHGPTRHSPRHVCARDIYYTQASETTWVSMKAGNFAVTLLVGMIAVRFVVDGSWGLCALPGAVSPMSPAWRVYYRCPVTVGEGPVDETRRRRRGAPASIQTHA
jgi:hypothetical protein